MWNPFIAAAADVAAARSWADFFQENRCKYAYKTHAYTHIHASVYTKRHVDTGKHADKYKHK